MKDPVHARTLFSGSRERIDTLNSLHVGVLVQGPGSEILFSNNAALQMLGLTQDELRDRSVDHLDWDVLHEDGSLFPPSSYPVYQAISTKKSISNIIMGVYRPLTKDRVWLQVHAEPLLDDDGEVKEVICSFSDITERKLAEEKLTGLYQHLENRALQLATSNADLQRFVYVATHDLQEPLRLVTSFTQLLKKKYEKQLDTQAAEYIDYAVEGASRMKKLILDLLVYSKFSSNGEGFTPTDMNQVVQDACDLFSEEIKTLQAKMIISELPVIKAKKSLMGQLFEQLISNALKYRTDSKPVIEIGCSEKEEEFLFSIRDNGIGIDPKYSEKIFILFQRLRNDHEAGDGTGVGLAISKKIIELHKGTIWVRSGQGKGSTFYFTIPKDPQPVV